MITDKTSDCSVEKHIHAVLIHLAESQNKYENYIRSESDGTRLTILFKSDLFNDMEVTKRQNIVWEELHNKFTDSICKRISCVYCKGDGDYIDEEELF